MFQAVFRRFSSPTLPVFPSGPGDCDLLIPVFNRPDLVRNLLSCLARTTNKSLLCRIFIGDDASDACTAATIDRLAAESGLPITVVHREKNLGFGENCNDLFQRSTASRCIILNTDIRLPHFWLERMLKPLELDPKIVLATPLSTNAANHTVRLQPGQHWMEADRLLAGRTPSFPDDCTAIGFCMAVNASLLKQKGIPLFDPAFGRGYGEDTDLHYRVLEAGYRSVIVDNLIVHHEGEASFSVLSDYNDIRAKGETKFRTRWATEHERSFADFQRTNALGVIRDQSSLTFLPKTKPRHLDFLFVIPSTTMRYGGIWFIFEVAQALMAAGFEVGLYSLVDKFAAESVRYGIAAFEDTTTLKTRVSSATCVVSTAQNTIRPALDLVHHYGAVDLLFLQCMEVVFRSGHNVDTFLQFSRIPNVLTVSDCLVDYIRIINPAVNVQRMRLGPDPLIFYPRPVERRPRTVLFAANLIPDKGTTQAMELALMLRSRGFHITMFGWDTASYPIAPEIGDMHTDTSRQSLAELFSRSEFIIEQSHLEGLGLLPLEAAACGCIPIIGQRGAAEYFFKDGENSITINGYKNLAQSLDRIDRMTEREKKRLRTNAMKLSSEFHLDLGLQDAVRAFPRMGQCLPPSLPLTLQDYALPQA